MKKTRAIWTVLALVIVLRLFLIYPVAAESATYGTTSLGEMDATDQGELDRYPGKIPTEIIPQEQVDQLGHTHRLPQAEGDMQTIMLGNKDGTNSLYVFSYPVKYIDSEGRVHDKSNILSSHVASEYAYINMGNDIQTHLPIDVVQDPIALTYDDYAIYSMPLTDVDSSVAQKDQDDTVVYPEVFGQETALRYQVDFNGYKEDIVIESENATTEFTFIMYCVNLEPVVQNGVIAYTDPNTDEVVFTTSPFFVYDSANEPNSYTDTDFTLTEISSLAYLLTVTVDEEYLEQEDLVYPIYVDPTLSFASSSYIDTATVYRNSPNKTSAGGSYGYVGFNGIDGEARMLIRFTDLRDNYIFRNLTAEQITSVKLNMHTFALGSGTAYITACQFAGNVNWTSNSSWSGAAAGTLGEIQSSCAIAGNAYGNIEFDITKAAKNWLGYSSNATNKVNAGIILCNNNTTDSAYCRSFHTENAGPSMSPYVVVNYKPLLEDGVYYIRNAENKSYAHAAIGNSSVSLKNFEAANTQKWQITLNSSGYYTIKSLNTQTYLGVSSLATDGSSSVISNATSSRGKQWAIIPSSNGRYILMANPVAVASNGTITYVLAGTSSSANSGTLTQIYSNTTNLRDEWELYQCKYEYTLDHYYDEGYNIRYTDSTSTALEKIKNYHNIVAEQYLLRFNLEVIPNFHLFSSKPDECKGTVTSENLSDECNHSAGHLTSTTIQIDFISKGISGTENCTTVFWTGHILSGNADSGSYSPNLHLVIVTSSTTTDDNYQNESAEKILHESVYILLHETSHQLAAQDHYCGNIRNPDNPGVCENKLCDVCFGDGQPRDCVMTDRFNYEEELYDANLYCSDCISIIFAHLEHHHCKNGS